jgi:hypothetical protein
VFVAIRLRQVRKEGDRAFVALGWEHARSQRRPRVAPPLSPGNAAPQLDVQFVAGGASAGTQLTDCCRPCEPSLPKPPDRRQ